MREGLPPFHDVIQCSFITVGIISEAFKALKVRKTRMISLLLWRLTSA